MTQKEKNKKRRKAALIGAIGTASLIVIGTTFAWFTSKDEVTNRLTASANYGVSIVEDFTPPSDWVPGQEVNKDVSAVNTGNIDAYVRLGILNDLKLTASGSGVAFDANATTLPTPATGETLVKLVKGSGDATTENSVTTIQAGATLVVKAGAPVPKADQAVRSGDDTTTANYGGSEGFTPVATEKGVYLFRRTYYEGTNGNQIKYSGYYFDGTDYYALETEQGTIYSTATVTENADGVVTEVTGLKLATTKETTISNKDTEDGKLISITWYKTGMAAATQATTTAGAADAKWIQLSFAAVTGNPVLLNIKLADDWATNWTYIQTNTDKIDDKNDFGYFYYNKRLPAGNTTEKLIDSVTLDKTVTQFAYNELVYDLSVVLDSVQVDKSSGAYSNSSITPWIAGATVDAADGHPTWTTP